MGLISAYGATCSQRPGRSMPALKLVRYPVLVASRKEKVKALANRLILDFSSIERMRGR
jgi:hypothetical protein